MIDRSRLVHELHVFARRLVTDYPVSDALHDLVDATTAILDVHGAGTNLADGDRLMFATAAPADIAALEEIQERDQVGPCVAAFQSDEPVVVSDLTTGEHPWPALTSVAAQTGISAVAAVPLRLNGTRLGALDIYSRGPHVWTAEEVETAELLAALATGYIANASRLDHARQTVEQLQEALDSRIVIEQAKGVLAGERGISVDQAFAQLRAHARHNQAPLRQVAQAVVDLGLRP
jgi:GAF domain-containing protein